MILPSDSSILCLTIIANSENLLFALQKLAFFILGKEEDGIALQAVESPGAVSDSH